MFGVKENEQLDLICNDITLKHTSLEKILGVTTDNKLSFDKRINNICKTANTKLNALSRISHLYVTKSKEIIIIIFYNLSFQLLSSRLDVLLQKIYQNDKYYL